MIELADGEGVAVNSVSTRGYVVDYFIGDEILQNVKSERRNGRITQSRTTISESRSENKNSKRCRTTQLDWMSRMSRKSENRSRCFFMTTTFRSWESFLFCPSLRKGHLRNEFIGGQMWLVQRLPLTSIGRFPTKQTVGLKPKRSSST